MGNGLLWTFIFSIFKNALFVAYAEIVYLNVTTNATGTVTDITPAFSITEAGGNASTTLAGRSQTFPVAESSATPFSNKTDEVTETVPTSLRPATDTSKATVVTATFTESSPTVTVFHWWPLPITGSLPSAVTDVSSVCPCNLLQELCDVNCCCDKDCSGETALFTTCSVDLIIADKQMCRREAASYSLSSTEDGYAQLQSSVQQEDSSDVFCIHTANYEAGLSFGNIEVPTNRNFDSLFRQFVGSSFSSAQTTADEKDPPSGSRYTYGDTIQTEDRLGRRGVFLLPTPAGTAHCSDANPAEFLKDQSTQCIRSFVLAHDCATLQTLSLQKYTGFSILSMKNDGNNAVAVETSSISLQSLDGTLTFLEPSDVSLYGPVLLEQPGIGKLAVCSNVVLQVHYVVTYSEAGAILACTTSFVLGVVNSSMLPIQQDFQIKFVQILDSPAEASFPSSGNPGYVVGLPLVAGLRTANGIVRSTDRKAGLTLLKSSASQDCLGGLVTHSPVLFGVSMVSGCTLRMEDPGNCSVVSEVLLQVLRGQEFPQYVASFGNSQPQMVMDWVPIKNLTTPTVTQGCSIALSRDIEVRWTKYGSLLNPQAQIVNVTEAIRTNTSSLVPLVSLVTLHSTLCLSSAAIPCRRKRGGLHLQLCHLLGRVCTSPARPQDPPHY